jgi:hypothetical protein
VSTVVLSGATVVAALLAIALGIRHAERLEALEESARLREIELRIGRLEGAVETMRVVRNA